MQGWNTNCWRVYVTVELKAGQLRMPGCQDDEETHPRTGTPRAPRAKSAAMPLKAPLLRREVAELPAKLLHRCQTSDVLSPCLTYERQNLLRKIHPPEVVFRTMIVFPAFDSRARAIGCNRTLEDCFGDAVFLTGSA